jgi:xanthine/CO dehydrogenase XdhC/CoxF family maturation factor
MVLATVYDTLGSTYSKAGHRIVIAANGDYQGLVSGGCLEGDLAERARRVLDERRALAVTYDLRDEADELFGLGIGCNGLIRVFLQPLFAETDYEPFASIAECLLDARGAAVATLIEGRREDGIAGGTLIRSRGETLRRWQVDEAALARLARGCDEALAAGRARYVVDDLGGVLYAPLKPVPRLLVLGAGLDAIPLVDLASDLGWLVTVADHRPGYVARGGFEQAVHALVVDPAALGESLELDSFDAVVVMSHHLGTDRAYLAALAGIDLDYLGVLGPPARKQRLIEELGDAGRELTHLRGPVGLDIGADSPESIALSIVAELQAAFAGAAATQT